MEIKFLVKRVAIMVQGESGEKLSSLALLRNQSSPVSGVCGKSGRRQFHPSATKLVI
jgi:hypothetical protein